LEFLKRLISSDFLPHGTCYLWDPHIVWLHVISDSLITLAYYCIPLALVYLVRKRRDLPFNWIFWMFGLFILGCGTTHLMEVWTVWHGTYLLSGAVKAFTAAVSVVTAVTLVPLVPKAIALPGPGQLQAINQELKHQAGERAQREHELVQLTQELELRIQNRTAELQSINHSLQKEIALGAESQQALRASQARLSSVIESATDAILAIDEEQRIVLFNVAAEKMFACSAKEAMGQPLSRLIPERFRASHAQYIHRFGETGATNRTMGAIGELWGLRADGTEVPIEASISQTEAAERKLFTVILRDMTERKQAEARNVLLATIVESSNDAIVSKDLSGRILSWNSGAQQIYGYTEAEIVGQSVDLIVPPDRLDESNRALLQVAAGRMVTRDETIRVRKDGSLLTVSLILSPMRNAEGQIIGISSIAHDITASKAAERQVRDLNLQLEKRVRERTVDLEAANKELEAFTYSVSHDLRAPLRHIAGFSKMLAEECGASLQPEALHYLRRIQDGTRRMGMLVDDLLNLARIGRHELRLQATGLHSIVKDVIAELTPDMEGRQIEWKIRNLPYVEGDPALLRVVFQNLLSNALKYTRPRAKAVIEVGCEQMGGEQVVFVSDNGVGFNMIYADKLFGVFERLHRSEDFEGSGVGLATAQRIVQKHGGRIWAQAELDKGATFYVSFGKAKDAEVESEAAMAGDIS
jgi:PAS domain S-box-containing protein